MWGEGARDWRPDYHPATIRPGSSGRKSSRSPTVPGFSPVPLGSHRKTPAALSTLVLMFFSRLRPQVAHRRIPRPHTSAPAPSRPATSCVWPLSGQRRPAVRTASSPRLRQRLQHHRQHQQHHRRRRPRPVSHSSRPY